MIGTARVDRSGRVQHSRILEALRWRPGDELLVDIAPVSADDASALLVIPEHEQKRTVAAAGGHPTGPAPRPTSRCRIDARGAITLPAPARALCGINTDSTIVAVAEPAANRLIVLSTAVAVRLLVAHLHAPTPGHAMQAAQPVDSPEGHPG